MSFHLSWAWPLTEASDAFRRLSSELSSCPRPFRRSCALVVQTEKIAGPQIVGVAVNEGEAALPFVRSHWRHP